MPHPTFSLSIGHFNDFFITSLFIEQFNFSEQIAYIQPA